MVDLDAEWDWTYAGVYSFQNYERDGRIARKAVEARADHMQGQANHFFRYAPEKV